MNEDGVQFRECADNIPGLVQINVKRLMNVLDVTDRISLKGRPEGQRRYRIGRDVRIGR